MIENGKIERIHLEGVWKFGHERLELRRQEEVEALRGAFVNRTRGFLECERISKCQLQYQLLVIEGEGRRRIFHEMKLWAIFRQKRVQLWLKLRLQTLGIG